MNYFRQYKPSTHNRMPPGVLNLIIINAILFIAKMLFMQQYVSADEQFAVAHTTSRLDQYLALYHPQSPDFHWYQYITSLFMHADVMHIAMNMFGLWLFGHLLENAWGLRRFLIFYLVCGVGASVIYQVWQTIEYHQQLAGIDPELLKHLHLDYPRGSLEGASGAVFGLIMGAAMLFPNTELPYLGFMGMPIRVKWIALFYGGGELYMTWQQSAGDNVAHLAHLGGMLFGFILVKIYSKSKRHFY